MKELQKKPKKTKKPKRVAKRPTRSSRHDVVIKIQNEFNKPQDSKPSRGLFKPKQYQERSNSGFSFGSTGPHYSAVSSPFQPQQSTLKSELSNLKETILETNIKQEKQANTLEKKGMALKDEVDRVVFNAANQDNREEEVKQLFRPKRTRRTKKEMAHYRLSNEFRYNWQDHRSAYETEQAKREAVGNAPSHSNSTESGLGNIGLGGFNSTKVSLPNRFASTPVYKKKHSVSPLVESSIEKTAERPLTESVGDLAETGIYGSEPPAPEPVLVDVVEEGKGQLGGIDALEPPLISSAYRSGETDEDYMAREGLVVSNSPRSPRPPPSVKKQTKFETPPPPPAGEDPKPRVAKALTARLEALKKPSLPQKVAPASSLPTESFQAHGNDMGFGEDPEIQYEPSKPSSSQSSHSRYGGGGRY